MSSVNIGLLKFESVKCLDFESTKILIELKFLLNNRQILKMPVAYLNLFFFFAWSKPDAYFEMGTYKICPCLSVLFKQFYRRTLFDTMY